MTANTAAAGHATMDDRHAGFSRKPSAPARPALTPVPPQARQQGNGPLDRVSAASVLREARNGLALGIDASDSCHWALMLLPFSRAAQRAMIDWLARSGALDDAAALISAALLQHGEDDWKLWLRRARVMHLLDRQPEADLAIRRVFEHRGDHRHFGALMLAANIARAVYDPEQARTRLQRADGRRPRKADVAQRIVDEMLALDRADDAAHVLGEMPNAPAALAARVLISQRRLRDARDLLESALAIAKDPAHRTSLSLQLIDLLQQIGDWPALRAMTAEENVIDAPPALAIRLAQSALSRGEFETAINLSRAALEAGDSVDRDRALERLCVISASQGDGQAAAEFLAERRAANKAMNPAAEAPLWLSAVLGTLAAEHCDPRAARRAGADPAVSVLDPLLRRTAAVFDSALAGDLDSAAAHGDVHKEREILSPTSEVSRWQRHRAMCERALHTPSWPDARSVSGAPGDVALESIATAQASDSSTADDDHRDLRLAA